MPADTPPSLEDLARAAVAAWQKWTLKGRVRDNAEFHDLAFAVARMERYLADPSGPPHAGDCLTRGERMQTELRFACALVVHAWPTNEQESQALIAKARHLARLLMDGPEPPVRRGLDAGADETPCG